MKRKLLLLLLMPVYTMAQQNTITLQKVNELAQQHYPLIKQKDLLKQTSVLP